jgi:hypothetical protein
MGLDWNPMNRPLPGAETEFLRVFRQLEGHEAPERGLLGRLFLGRGLTKGERARLTARFQALTEPPYTVLGAPRVGIDAAADAWLREQLTAQGKDADFEVAREKMRGYYVLALAPACDGFPRYTPRGAYGLERYSFRGQFLEDVAGIIGEPLHAQAYEAMLASELAEYADALEAATLPYARQHGLEHLAHARSEETFELGAPASNADILFSAIRWCRFWSQRGFGLAPWF